MAPTLKEIYERNSSMLTMAIGWNDFKNFIGFAQLLAIAFEFLIFSCQS